MSDEAPAPIAAPVATPATNPTVLSDADALIQSDDDAFAAEFGLDALGTEGGEERIITVDDDAEDTPAEDEPVAEEPAAEPAADAAPAADTKPVTTFQVFDGEGKEITEPDTRTFSFKANGKVHEGLTLDRVVRLAQTGFYNEKLVKETDEVRAAIPQFQEYIGKLEKFAQELVDSNEKLIADDDYLLKEREKAEAANTPEAQRQRDAQKIRDLENQQYLQHYNTQLTGFNTHTVLPALQNVRKDFPTVSEEEVFGRLAMLTAPLLVNGRVPEKNFARVAHLLESDLGPWASQLHESRQATVTRQAAEVKTAVAKAQEKTADVKRTLGRALKPSGKPVTAAPVARARPILSIDDAEADVLAELRALGGQ